MKVTGEIKWSFVDLHQVVECGIVRQGEDKNGIWVFGSAKAKVLRRCSYHLFSVINKHVGWDSMIIKDM